MIILEPKKGGRMESYLNPEIRSCEIRMNAALQGSTARNLVIDCSNPGCDDYTNQVTCYTTDNGRAGVFVQFQVDASVTSLSNCAFFYDADGPGDNLIPFEISPWNVTAPSATCQGSHYNIFVFQAEYDSNLDDPQSFRCGHFNPGDEAHWPTAFIQCEGFEPSDNCNISLSGQVPI